VADVLELTWDNVDFLLNCLSDELKRKSTKYDTIVALGRGGLIPATTLSYKLGILSLYNLGISTREDQGKYKETLVYQKPNNLSKDSKILIVDDINDSGRTFTAVKSILLSEYGIDDTNVLYVSLVQREGTEFFKNTISGNILHTSRWLVFPWDK
jgi:hypoxanthine phosphoribosyltransferase